MTRHSPALIRIFTPSDAGADNTNAQNLTVKEVVARLPHDRFHVTMLCEGEADRRLVVRPNTRLVKWTKHGNTIRLLRHCLFPAPQIYFFPRTGPLDQIFFDLRKRLGLSSILVSYIVMAMNTATARKLIRRSITEGNVVVGNSRYVAETIQSMFHVAAEVVYDGVDRRFYFSHEKRDLNPNTTVLYAGSFQPRKRVELVIQQAGRLPNVQFRLAGKGETEQDCRELVRSLGCTNVSFLGHLSSERLGEEMRAADIFFFPSILEGNPQVLLQAAACGLPSVAMELYRSDYLVHGRTGFQCCTEGELSENLDRLVSDVSLRHSFSAAAIRHSHQFDWDGVAKQWAAIFLESASRREGNCARRGR